LTSDLRLRRGADFRRVYSTGRRVEGRLLVVHVAPGEAESSRLGFSVSTKVGNAVLRNRVRRRLREAARPLVAGVTDHLDVVVVARPGAAAASFAELASELRELTGKLVSF
jgi:ribonuclease P protein component